MHLTIRGIAAVFLLSACSLDEGGGAAPDASPIVPDASTDATSDDAPVQPDAPPVFDAPPAFDAPADSPVDAPPTCAATGACTTALPAGWTPMAVPTNASTACPSGFAATDRLAQVTAVAGACDCGCNVTTDPVCDVGSMQRFVSNDSSCGTTGVLLTINGGGCTAGPAAGPVSDHGKSTPLGPSGGVCGGTVVEDKAKVTKTVLRTCDGASCAENVCKGDVPLGFSACVVKAGNEPTCPAGFTAQRTLVGADFTLGCSSCACNVNGPSTCTGATLKYYSDPACNNVVTAGPVDGVCNANQNVGSNWNHFKYAATLNRVCTASGAKTAAPALAQPTTVCCK